MSDVPQRIGDAERDKAVQELQAHHAAGRLTLAEFDERMQSALQARTMADLRPLFRDLPSPDFQGQYLAVPAASAASSVATTNKRSSEMERRARTARTIGALMWPVALIINFAFGWEWWWLMLVPVFVMPVLMNAFGVEDPKDKKKRKELE